MWYNVFEVRELRILSIDFDYFVNPTALQRALYFPDGGREMSDTLNTFVWAGAYAVSYTHLAREPAPSEEVRKHSRIFPWCKSAEVHGHPVWPWVRPGRGRLECGL